MLTLAIVTVIGRGHCQNNCFIEFSIYVDRQAPQYDNYSINTTIINNINESFELSSQWLDDYKLDYYAFEWNITGGYKNETNQFVDDWANITKTINNPLDEGKNVSMRFHATDVSGNWNSTEYKELIITSMNASYYYVEQNDSSPYPGDPVLISSYWTDNFQVNNVYYQTNETEDWLNNGSPVTLNATSGWANFTINTTGMTSGPVYWRLRGLDAIGNSNESPINFFTVN